MEGGPKFLGVVRLLVGGLAARLDLPYEQMDDLQLAAESVLAVDLAEYGVPVELVERDLRSALPQLAAAA